MAIAILGIGTAFITSMFVNGYRLWKKSFDELLMTQSARRSMAVITRALREANPGSVELSTPGGMPRFSTISFLDGRGRSWVFRQRIKGVDTVIPGHNPVLPWSAFVEFGDFMKWMVDTTAQAVKDGKTAEQAAAGLTVPEKFKHYNMQRGPAAVTTIYGELKK